MRWICVICATMSVGCAGQNPNERENERPCDPRGPQRVQLSEFKEANDRQMRLTEELVWELERCEGRPPVAMERTAAPAPGATAAEIIDACRAAQETVGCQWACVLHDLRLATAQQASAMQVFIEREFPAAVQAHPECELPATRQSEEYFRCLGFAELPFDPARARLDMVMKDGEQKLTSLQVAVQFPSGLAAEFTGYWEGGGCGTGPVWSSRFQASAR